MTDEPAAPPSAPPPTTPAPPPRSLSAQSLSAQSLSAQSPAAEPPSAARGVVILGGTSAIAQAVARLYAAEKARILLAGRSPDRLSDVARDLTARGAAHVETAALDLAASAREAPARLDEWAGRIGRIDHVILAYGVLGEAEDATQPDRLARLLEVDFTSAALWCAAAAELFAARRSGSLVVIGSVAGDRGRQSNYAYGAAKGGLALFVQGLAHRLADAGARAVVVKPGFVDTPMTAGFDKGGPLWANPDAIARRIRRAADHGGPIQYAPGLWRWIMLAIRATPSLIFHRTRL